MVRTPQLLPVVVLVVATVAAVSSALAMPLEGAPESGTRIPDDGPGRHVVLLERDAPLDPTIERLATRGIRAGLRYRHAVRGFSARLSPSQVNALQADPAVAVVAPDRPLKASDLVPAATGETIPPGIRRVSAATPAAVRPPSGIRVAVIDTGIDLDHPDLRVEPGINCMGSGAPDDANGHGTHVAGTIAARNQGSEVTGVAPGTTVVAVKVLDAQGSGSTSSVLCGIDWVAGTRTDADPANDVAVANMSLGGTGSPVGACLITDDPMHRAICRATGEGITFVVAAGNEAWDFDYAPAPDVPAAYPEVLTVAAMTDTDGKPGALGPVPSCRSGEADDRRASFSNFAATTGGAAHTVAAPGTCIRSTWPGGGTAVQSGTSMAAPHVTGLVALCLNERVDGRCMGRTPAEIVSLMVEDARERAAAAPEYGFTVPGSPPPGVTYGPLAWGGFDDTPPAVISIAPADGAGAVATSSAITVSFSELMDQGSAASWFSLAGPDGATVPGSVSWSGTTMTFRPTQTLAPGAAYLAVLGAGAEDPAMNPVGSDERWSFTTVRTATVGPGAVTMESGSIRSGGASQLLKDDGSYLAVNSTSRKTYTTSWYGRFAGVPNDLTALRVTYRGKSSTSCSQTVSVWRWTTSSWVSLDARSVSTTEVTVARDATGSLADLVEGTEGPGEVRIRVRCTRSSSSFVARGDLMSIRYEHP